MRASDRVGGDAAIPDAPVTPASAVQGMFTVKKEEETTTSDTQETLTDPPVDERHLVFLAHWDSEDAQATSQQELIGFTRILEEPLLNSVVGSPLIVDVSLSQPQQEAVHAGAEVLVEVRAKAELEEDVKKSPVPDSNAFWRSMFTATEFAKTLFVDNGFIDNNLRLEMRMELSKIDTSEDFQVPAAFPGGIQVKAIDPSDSKRLPAAYDAIKMAFGSNPPSFEAWKIHYAQQPRFAPELSFVAWNTDDEAVAAIGIERIVEGEGGGDAEVLKMFATHGKLVAKADKEPVEPSAAVLEFPDDFEERKERVMQQATVAYVCGAATKAEHRGKGLASGLLQRAFQEAAKTPLQQIMLGTAALNKSAVRAYERAGMVETKRFSSGMTLTKQIAFVHSEP